MIFITVGTQLSFERLISTVDSYFLDKPDSSVFAQVGPSEEKPENIESAQFITPMEAEKYFKKADLIVAHAGMGSILTALRFRKPILVMPRRESLKEIRNDHQMATAKWLQTLPGVFVAWNEQELITLLERQKDLVSGSSSISEDAEEQLISFLKGVIKNS